MKKIITTLLFILKDKQILLAEKKRGFGKGKLNGVGGKLEAGETIEQAMLRETKEEIGIIPKNYQKQAVITFDEFVKGERQLIEMHVYLAKDYEGIPQETEEMNPIWFSLNKIPYDKMFVDEKYWLPLILENKQLTAEFKFDENFNLLEYSVNELKDNQTLLK